MRQPECRAERVSLRTVHHENRVHLRRHAVSRPDEKADRHPDEENEHNGDYREETPDPWVEPSSTDARLLIRSWFPRPARTFVSDSLLSIRVVHPQGT